MDEYTKGVLETGQLYCNLLAGGADFFRASVGLGFLEEADWDKNAAIVAKDKAAAAMDTNDANRHKNLAGLPRPIKHDSQPTRGGGMDHSRL